MENVPVRVTESVRKNAPAGQKPKGKKPGLKTVILSAAAVLLFAALVVGGLFLYRAVTGSVINKDKYQAVFLTSGQVYFGKLDNIGGEYSKLTDVFYIQATETDSDEADAQNPQEEEAATDLQLIKLGSEVHGPEDEMIINKEQILFVENLKTDGKVSDSIRQYYNNLNG